MIRVFWSLLSTLLAFNFCFAQERSTEIQVVEVKNTSSSHELVNRYITSKRPTHWADILSVSFHPNGKRIASGGVDRSIRVWNAETLELVDSIEYLGGIVSHVKYMADGRIVAVLRDARDQDVFGTSNSTVLVLKPSDGRWVEQSRLTGFVRNIQSVVATPDAKRMMLDDGLHAIHVYDIQAEHPVWIQTIVFPAKILAGTTSQPLPSERESFTGSGRAVVVNGGQGIPWEGPLPVTVGSPTHRAGEKPLSLAVSKDGSILVGVTNKKIRAWKIGEQCDLIGEVDGTGTAVVISPDNQHVVVAQDTGSMDVWTLLETGFVAEPDRFERGIKNLTALDISADGQHLAVGQYQGHVTGVIEFNEGNIGTEPIELVEPNIDRALRLANGEMHWVEAEHNRAPHRVPVAFHPNKTQVATVRHRRFLQVSEITVDAKAPTFESSPGDPIALWHASDRRVQCLSDDKTLFVTTPYGATTIDSTTGEMGDEIRSQGHPAIAPDSSIVWTFHSAGRGSSQTAIHELGTNKTRSLDCKWIDQAKRGNIAISPEGGLLAWQDSARQQILVFQAKDEHTITLPISNPPARIIGFDRSQKLLVSHIGRSDFGGTLHQVMEYDLSGDGQPVAQKRYEARASDPTKDRFVLSRNRETVLFQEADGRFHLLSDPSSRRSRRSADPIECVSGDGEFLVTSVNHNLGDSVTSVLRTSSGQPIQHWRLPGVITDLDLSADESFIATVNADGSIGRLELLDRAQWPDDSNNNDATPSSSVEEKAETELQALLDQAADEIQAYQARIAKASDEDETLETMCSEPYSTIILRLTDLARQYPGTDIEFTALHRAIGMRRVTPRHVPGASWTKKRSQWYKISRSADDRLKNIARLDFADRFIDDPRTASVLRQAIEYWRTKETTAVMDAAMELYQRSSDRSVQAAALLIYAEANTGEQVQFLMSGHRITQPTADQLRRAEETLRKVQKEFTGIRIDGIGDVAQRAADLLQPTGATE